MCEFMSWIEYQGKIYFLDDNKLNTKEGRELLQYLGDRKYEDIPGHGAILHYYPELKHKGKDKECTDFSTPDNFPSKIVEAIKKGLFVNFGACPQILTASALDLFLRSETGKIYAELEKERAELEKACDEWYKTLAEWKKTLAEWKKTLAEWEKARAKGKKACAELEKARTEWKKADTKGKKACAELEKARTEWKKADTKGKKARAEWEKADKSYFWQLARIKKNRIKLWQ